ncbi:MAG: glycosyltransferase, partial [Deltaproteobacteria bacterium]|nr:glycosyltransferase [Deltaproteobacteria bacterium]
MKMCSALARRGHEVVLVVKRGKDLGVDDHDYYCVDRNFTLEKLPRPARRGGGMVYAMAMAGTVLRRRAWADLIYSRDQIGTILAARTKIPLVWEAHGVPSVSWRRRAIANAISRPQAAGVVTISEALRRDLQTTGITNATSRVVVAHDACDLPTISLERQPHSRPVVGYVGGLHPGRGIEMVVALASA